jgi:hypothetical protein
MVSRAEEERSACRTAMRERVQGDGAGDGLCEDEERWTETRFRRVGRCGRRMKQLAETEEFALFGGGVGQLMGDVRYGGVLEANDETDERRSRG